MAFLRRRPPVEIDEDDEPTDLEALLLPGGLDGEWYSSLLGRQMTREEAAAHYLAEGREMGLTPHPLIDAEYLRRTILAVPMGTDTVAHYYRNPQFRDVQSHALFSTTAWLDTHPEALDYPGGPAEHYLRVGLPAGEMPSRLWPDVPAEVLPRLRSWTRGLAGLTDPPAPPAAPTVIVIRPTGHLPRLTRLLGSLEAAHDDAPVLLPTAGIPRSSAFIVALMQVSNPWVDVVLTGPTLTRDQAWSTLVAGMDRQSVLVVLDSETEVTPGWLPPLVRALDDPATAVAGPVVLDADGLIRSAGLVGCASGGWAPVLAGFAGDELAAGGWTAVGAPADAAAAVRVRDVPLEAADAAPSVLGAMLGGRSVVCHDSVVIAPEARDPEVLSVDRPSGPDESEVWATAGLSVTHSDGGHVATRLDRTTLRWAIKCAALPGSAGETWGDLHFARELSAALRRRGHHVVIDRAPTHDRDTGRLDDVAVLLRGLNAWVPQPPMRSVLWVISHPDDVTVEEAGPYDVVGAASDVWAQRVSTAWGRVVHPLLQATDTQAFHPDCATPDDGPPVLFVGVNKGAGRPLVEWAAEAGLPLQVYGPGWGNLPEGMWLGERIARSEVPALYRSAGLVLCEHAAEMAADGFVQNRIFDVLAAGGRAVSNPVVGLESVAPGVAVVTGPDDLRALYQADRREFFGDDAAVRQRAEWVAEHFSFDARARTLEELLGL